MPRGRKKRAVVTDDAIDRLSADAAKSMLMRLVNEGRVSASEISSHVMEEVETLRQRIDSLLGSVGQAATRASRKVTASAETAVKTTRKAAKKAKRAISPERRAMMQLQGQYLALSRKLSSAKQREALKKAYKEATSATAKEKVLKEYAP